jgi:ParB-like chromosome segregation protein Spo0J
MVTRCPLYVIIIVKTTGMKSLMDSIVIGLCLIIKTSMNEKEGRPVPVINKSIDNRMASTIRHNRARGTHDVDLMSNIVCELHNIGRSDAWIAKHLGMDADEILRLKQITGIAEMFKDSEFSRAWEPAE